MMNDPAQSPDDRPKSRATPRGPILIVWIGLFVVIAGTITYFLFFVRFPTLRDFPWVNLPAVVLGLAISAEGLRRALVDRRIGLNARLLAGVPFVLSLTIAALFGAYLFFLSYRLPETDAVVQVSQPAPDFALPDQHGQTVRLSDLRGRKVVLDFYRGHW
jgi:hypothetical protein